MSNKLKSKRIKKQPMTLGDQLALVPCDHIDSTRYTFDSWRRSQEDSIESYKNIQCPEDFLTYMLDTCTSYGILHEGKDGLLYPHRGLSENFAIRPVVIDNEYYEYLTRTQKEDNTQSRTEYMNSVSDTNVLRLLKKHHLNWTLTLFAIPVMIVSETPFPSEMSLSLEDKKSEITNILSGIYGLGNVYVPGYICHTNYIAECEDAILDEAYTYFHEGTRTSIGKYKIQPSNNEKANLTFYFIPIVVKHEFNSPRITLSQLINNDDMGDDYKIDPLYICFEDEFDDVSAVFDPEIQHCKFSFKKSGLDELIKKAFPAAYQVEVLPFWEYIENCAGIIADYVIDIQKAMDEKLKTQNLLNNYSFK